MMTMVASGNAGSPVKASSAAAASPATDTVAPEAANVSEMAQVRGDISRGVGKMSRHAGLVTGDLWPAWLASRLPLCVPEMTTTLKRTARAAALVLVAAVPPAAAAESGRTVLTGGIATHVVVRGETLFSLAARMGVDVEPLAADNRLDRRQALRLGQRLTVDNRHIVATDPTGADIIVNLPQRMLFFFSDGEVVGLPVAVGRRTWPTPSGDFRVVTRETDPTWDVPASIRAEARQQGRTLPRSIPPGPANPLGRFWVGLTGGAIGLHGTNVPSSIYGAVTHGCMRLHPDDIAGLFPRLQIGMTVRTVYEPFLLAEVDGRVFLEVHPDVYRRAPVSLAAVRARAAAGGLIERIDWTQAARVVALHHGIARDVTGADGDALLLDR